MRKYVIEKFLPLKPSPCLKGAVGYFGIVKTYDINEQRKEIRSYIFPLYELNNTK